MTLDVRLTRWSDDRPPPDEPAARALLSAENLAPYAWGNPPHDRYPSHRHPYHKVLVCLAGSIVFDLPELGRSVELRPGDRLDLPPNVLHAAVVGGHGVVCLEAHRSRVEG